MAFALPSYARVLQEGDSLSDDAFSYRVMNQLRAAAYAAYAQPVPRGPKLTWRNCATSGATSAIVQARIAGEVAAANPTHFILALGVNDAQTGVDITNVTVPNMTAILAALPSTCQILYFDPLSWGEKWPTGQNGAVDTAIELLSSSMQTLLLATYPLRSTFWSVRHTVYAVQEPLLNTPGPGTTMGPLTRPDSLGAHPNALGVGFYATQSLSAVSFPG